MKISSQRADNYSDSHSKDSSCGLSHGIAAYHTGNASGNGSTGINFPDQYIRSFSSHNISEDTASYPSKNANKNKEKSIILRDYPGCGLNSYHGKNAQPYSIAPKHDFVIIPVFNSGL